MREINQRNEHYRNTDEIIEREILFSDTIIRFVNFTIESEHQRDCELCNSIRWISGNTRHTHSEFLHRCEIDIIISRASHRHHINIHYHKTESEQQHIITHNEGQSAYLPHHIQIISHKWNSIWLDYFIFIIKLRKWNWRSELSCNAVNTSVPTSSFTKQHIAWHPAANETVFLLPPYITI
jgi:hypothetical protein